MDNILTSSVFMYLMEKYSATTWLLLLGPIVAFFALTIWVVYVLYQNPMYRPIAPIALGFAIVFGVAGILWRFKFGKVLF
ncbi:hypothetical protein [Sulfuracidifex metallicus]|jgi:hypothetical protein|uniref:Uncharacterized protein n=2 Tax=Sulfuracidifex metallicus TaxID=47303 RepID=A0A6A9QTG9_SULME|nr:hypothetical protein [Sulfuracidifex metallicus]MUN28442.1 hypothetical protein [Sulfuracidifex metallicus DSM 6482 = JCM 9184]